MLVAEMNQVGIFNMRKSLIMGTREDVSRMRSRNEASQRGLHIPEHCYGVNNYYVPSTQEYKRRIVTFNHPILGN